jgi:putative ubiquitin-RnfH superfamily antitoxin RatB of RatAB toxin-antitoxin module
LKRSAAVRIEVVYALADAQDIVFVELPEGAGAAQALAASGMLARHGLAAAQLQLGVFGKKISPEDPLREGDRIEILRPLAMDPKEARRRRARKTRV